MYDYIIVTLLLKEREIIFVKLSECNHAFRCIELTMVLLFSEAHSIIGCLPGPWRNVFLSLRIKEKSRHDFSIKV